MNEEMTEQALVKAVFALESLLGRSNNGNIAKSLSIYSAVLIYDNFEERIQMKQKIKDLYNIRSKIVHGELTSFFREQYIEICQIVRDIITTLINNNKFKEFTKFVEIDKYIEQISYS